MKRWVIAAAAAWLGSVVSADAAIGDKEAARLKEAAGVVQQIRSDIPQQYWDRARCVAVVPNLKKGAFIFGGEYGKGVMSCRAGDRWSAPVFMQLAKGSWGFQAGAEEVDVVLLIMNEEGVQKLLQNKVTLGADASVAAGPIGRQSQVATDAALKAEILAYSRAQGLFAGINLSGGVLRPDEDANRSVYGPAATPRTILASREISAPPEATPFLHTLGAASSATTGAASSTSAPRAQAPATTTTATTTTKESDLRARIIEMQRSLDAMLLGGSAAVGTTGTTGTSSGTITVDRAKLMQLRQQLDALLSLVGSQ